MSVAALATAGSVAAGTVMSLADQTLKASAKVEAVAKDFESLCISELLKQMRQTLDSGAMFGSDSADIHGGLFDFFMSKHLANAGGFGVAGALQAQLRPANHEPAKSA